MVIVNRLYKLRAGIFSCCLICLLMVGCGGKADSPDKSKDKQQSQEIVRQKIPGADETKPNAAPGTQQNKPVGTDKAANVSQPAKAIPPPAKTAQQQIAEKGDQVSTPAAQETKPVPAGQTDPVTGNETGKQLAPEKQAEIEAITKEAKTAAKVEAATKQVEELVAAKQQEARSETGQSLGEGTAVEGAAPVVDLGNEPVESDTMAVEEEEPDSGGFFNPFAPLFQKDNTGVSMAELPSFREQREFLTPLEKIDIGQLTLKGVIQAESGNRAILVDASGEGYVISKGAYVGLNSGTVEKIESDRVVIVESIGTRQSQTVLKLQKPAGE